MHWTDSVFSWTLSCSRYTALRRWSTSLLYCLCAWMHEVFVIQTWRLGRLLDRQAIAGGRPRYVVTWPPASVWFDRTARGWFSCRGRPNWTTSASSESKARLRDSIYQFLFSQTVLRRLETVILSKYLSAFKTNTTLSFIVFCEISHSVWYVYDVL